VDAIAILAALTAGVAVLLLVVGVFGRSRPVASERLQQLTASQVPATATRERNERRTLREAITRSPVLTNANRLVERRAWSERISRDLARADLTLRPIEYMAVRFAVIVGTVALFWGLARVVPALGHPLVLVAAALLGFTLPRLYVRRRQDNRLNAFNARLADTITLIGNALRSGSSLLQAIEMVVRETQPPVSTEFNRVIREVNLGLTTEQALNNMVRRVRSSDLELMVTAVIIQYQVGGNLAEILDTIAFTIRERVRIKGEIRTLTAQQRMSGYVVGFLPIGLMVIISLIAPQFMSAMFVAPPDVAGIPLGVVLLAFGGTLMFVGFMFIRRIVDIET
jgi:tight adherence protein B